MATITTRLAGVSFAKKLEAYKKQVEPRLVFDENECLIWTGAQYPRGYGEVKVGGRKYPPMHTHRITWEALVGPIPKGLWVLHHCDNPPCCNPEHLYLGTPADNGRDMKERGRGRNAGWKGEDHPRAILTEKDVHYIRSSKESLRVLARRYGVKHQTIARARKGQSWSHV